MLIVFSKASRTARRPFICKLGTRVVTVCFVSFPRLCSTIFMLYFFLNHVFQEIWILQGSIKLIIGASKMTPYNFFCIFLQNKVRIRTLRTLQKYGCLDTFYRLWMIISILKEIMWQYTNALNIDTYIYDTYISTHVQKSIYKCM